MKKNSGFSIIELMVALAILAILAALSLPAMRNMAADQRLKQAARELYNNMHMAKMQSIRTNQNWAIFFDSSAHTYSICSSIAADGTCNTIVNSVNLTNYQSGIDFGFGSSGLSGSTISYTNNVVIFTPRGLTTEGGKYVLISNDTGTVYQIGSASIGSLTIKRWGTGGWR